MGGPRHQLMPAANLARLYSVAFGLLSGFMAGNVFAASYDVVTRRRFGLGAGVLNMTGGSGRIREAGGQPVIRSGRDLLNSTRREALVWLFGGWRSLLVRWA